MLGLLLLLVVLAAAFFSVICWCLIFRKAGWHWALGLLTLVPIANLIVFLMLTFAEWPIQRQLRAAQMGTGPRPG